MAHQVHRHRHVVVGDVLHQRVGLPAPRVALVPSVQIMAAESRHTDGRLVGTVEQHHHVRRAMRDERQEVVGLKIEFSDINAHRTA